MPAAVQRFALCAISATILVMLALVAALAAGAFSPAGAAPADDYEANERLIAQVRGYAQETANGYEHVSRWIRVLKSFGALDEITAAEAQGFADEYLATRWNPVVEALRALEAGPAGYEPDQQLVADLRGYAGETQNGYEHVLRWFRALNTLGALEGMTAAEAQGYAERGWARWVPVAAALAELEAASAEPEQAVSREPAPKATPPAELQVSVAASPAHPRVNEAVILSPAVVNAPEAGSPTYRWEIEGNGDWHAYGSRAELHYLAAQAESWTFRVTLTYDSGASATSDPYTVTWVNPTANQAPVVNKRAEDYPWFTGQNNAPRGTLVSKQYYQIFDDPDGDELTYSVAITGGDSNLVDDLQVTTEAGRKPRNWPPYGTYYRVWFQADGENDWKAISPTLPDRPVVTVTLTATDPDGLSASVSGDFVIGWESYPEVVSARTRVGGQFIDLTFDWPVESSPSPNPGQFTVRAVNDDGSSGSVGVNSVAVNGKLVTLELASALERRQTVTLDYAYLYHLDTHNPLQRVGGGDHAPGFTGQVVEIQRPPSEPQNLAVTAERGKLGLLAEWDASEGATSYQLRWRRASGKFEAANAITVSDTETTITVSGFGEWEVLLQACNDLGCVPQNNRPVDEAPAVRLNLEPIQDGEVEGQARAQSRAQTVTASGGQVDDAAFYTLGWRRAGANAPSPTQSQSDTARLRSVTRGPSGQAGTAETTAPRIVRGEIDGDTMTFYFSEPLDEDAAGSRFRVTLHFSNGWANFTAHPSKVEVSGNKVVVIGLSRNGWPGWERASADNAVEAYYYIDDRVVPARERLRDLDGNEVWTPHRSLGGHFPATRTIWLRNLTAPPALQHATANSRWLTLTFDETLDQYSVPAASAFTVRVNGSKISLASVDPVIVFGDTVRLVLDSPLRSSDEVNVSYAKPSANRLRGLDGEVRSFSGRSVTNLVRVTPEVADVTISSTPADRGIYAPGETISVRLTLTEAVNVDETGGTPRLQIKLGRSHGERWANYAGGSGTTMLTFAYTVVEPDRSTQGVAVLRDGLDLNGGAIRRGANQRDANLWYAGLDHDPDHQVDWRRSGPGVPWVTGVNISSTPGDDDTYAIGDAVQVTVTFSETVNVDVGGGTPHLKIKMDPSAGEKIANYAAGSGTTELKFDYTVVESNRSTEGVALLGNTLELNGGTIQSTATTPVNALLRYAGLDHDSDHLVDGVRPLLRDMSVSVSETTLSMTFSETLDADSVPPASAFTVKRTPRGGDEETVPLSGPPRVVAATVTLSLTSAVLATDTGVTVSYHPPAEGAGDRLRDQAGNDAASFSEAMAEADSSPPRLLRSELSGASMILHFNEALDEDSIPGYFRLGIQRPHSINDLARYGECRPPQIRTAFTARPWDVYVSGNTVLVFGMGSFRTSQIVEGGLNHNDIRYIHSIAPEANSLSDLAGNLAYTPVDWGHGDLWETSWQDLDSVTELPSPQYTTVVGKRLSMIFDAPLNAGAVPPASAFTVKANGNSVRLASSNPVAVSGDIVTLTLATPIGAGQVVTVSYERPRNRRVQDVICEQAESFSDLSVTNLTGVAEVSSVAITSDPGDDDTYGQGETIRVKLTFSEAVDVTGMPLLIIDLQPQAGGEKHLFYESGSGTTELIFVRKVLQSPPLVPEFVSTSGIAVLANSLRPNGGAIRYVSSGKLAYLAHDGLAHDRNHKVNWKR